MYHLCMLIFALLITGANLPAGSADAQTADTTSDVEKLVFEFTAAGENDGHDGDTNEGIVTKLNGEVVDFYGHDGDEAVDENNTSTSSRTFFPMKIANQIAKMKRPVYKVTSLTEGATLKFWDFRWDGLIVDGDTEGAINGATLKDGIFTYYNIKGTDVNKKDYILGETEIGIDLSAEYEDGETPEPPAWNGNTFLGFGLDFGASATIEIYDAGEDIEASQFPETTASVTKAPGYIPDGEKLVFEFTAAGEDDGNATSSRTFFPMEITNQIAKMKRPVYKVTSLTDGATLKLWDFCWEGMWTIGDQTGNINNSYIKDGEFLGTQKRNTVVIDYKLGETEIGIDLSGEYEDGETPVPPAWNGDTFLGFGLDFGASATIEIYDTAEEEIEPSLLPEHSSTPAPPVATSSLEPSFRPAVISTVAPLPEQSNIPAGVPGSNVTPEQSSVPSVSKKVKVSGRKYNSQRLTFRVKGKKKGNTVIYVIIGEKSRKIKVICL